MSGAPVSQNAFVDYRPIASELFGEISRIIWGGEKVPGINEVLIEVLETLQRPGIFTSNTAYGLLCVVMSVYQQYKIVQQSGQNGAVQSFLAREFNLNELALEACVKGSLALLEAHLKVFHLLVNRKTWAKGKDDDFKLIEASVFRAFPSYLALSRAGVPRTVFYPVAGSDSDSEKAFQP